MKLFLTFFLLFCFFSVVVSAPQADSEEYEEEDFEAQFDQAEQQKSSQTQTPTQKADKSQPPPPSKSRSTPNQKKVMADDEEFDDFGEEEFYEVPPKKSPPPKEEKKKRPTQETFYFEVFYFSLIALYVVTYYLGKNENERIALSWIVTFEELLKRNFSEVGGGGVLLAKESYSNFTLTAKGRINCLGLQANLELIKRQDLFSRLYAYLSSTPDKLTIDIPLTSDCMDQFSFLLIRKRLEKSYQKDHQDIRDFCEPFSRENLPKGFVVLSDSSEVVDEILTTEVLVTITGSEPHLQSIHISDQSPFNPVHKKSMRIVMTVPDEKNMESIDLLFKMCFFILDRLPRVALSKTAKDKIQKKRLELVKQAEKLTHQQRQEAMQQRKIEKIQKEKEKISTLSPEAQAKYEEKEQRKQLRKRQMKFKVYQ